MPCLACFSHNRPPFYARVRRALRVWVVIFCMLYLPRIRSAVPRVSLLSPTWNQQVSVCVSAARVPAWSVLLQLWFEIVSMCCAGNEAREHMVVLFVLMAYFWHRCCPPRRVQEVLDGLAITNDHFKFALQHCNPSALRETLVEVRGEHDSSGCWLPELMRPRTQRLVGGCRSIGKSGLGLAVDLI